MISLKLKIKSEQLLIKEGGCNVNGRESEKLLH